jgi:hypothetical protein
MRRHRRSRRKVSLTERAPSWGLYLLGSRGCSIWAECQVSPPSTHIHLVDGAHPERLRVERAFGVIVGASAQAALPASPERRYALREIKARFAQASFRDAVLSAYGGRCAISHLPEPRLLDAALEWPAVNEDHHAARPHQRRAKRIKKRLLKMKSMTY